MAKEVSERDRRAMEAIVSAISSATKSDKIRALDREGYKPADIARFLGIRDQFVSNVRRRDKAKREPVPAQVAIPVGSDGRIVIPSEYREFLGVKDGGDVVLRLDDGGLRLSSRAADIRHAQSLVARYVPEGVSLVDELISERRREARGKS